MYLIDSGLVGRKVFFIGEVPRGEKMLYFGTDPESYTAKYTSEDNEEPILTCGRARRLPR